MDLFEWTKEYVKFKDMLKKKIVNMIFDENKLIVEEKDNKKITYFIHENIVDCFKEIENKKNEDFVLVCLNTYDNVEFVEKNWNKLIEYEKLVIIFTNPKTNIKWLLKPHIHNKIIDVENLKEGLMSLHRGIDLN